MNSTLGSVVPLAMFNTNALTAVATYSKSYISTGCKEYKKQNAKHTTWYNNCNTPCVYRGCKERKTRKWMTTWLSNHGRNKRYITDHYFAASSQTGAAPGAQIISLLVIDQWSIAFWIFVFVYCIFVFLFSLFPNRSRPWGSNYITVESRCIVIRFYMRLMPCFSQHFLNVSPAGQTLPHEKSRQKSSEKEEGGRRGGAAPVAWDGDYQGCTKFSQCALDTPTA